MADKNMKPNQDFIPNTLPLLELVNQFYKLKQAQPFVGFKIFAVQHLLGSTIPFFKMLEEGGAKPKDIYIVGKAYSSHPLVVDTLIKNGYNLSFDEVFDHKDDEPYDNILEKHIVATAKKIFENFGESKGLLIDDGGKAIKLLHHTYEKLTKRFFAVEQTSRGARTVSGLKLMCPVVNVARSEIKTKYESPHIAKAMVEELIILIQRWSEKNTFNLKGKTVLLLGYGFIGEQVAKQFKNHDFTVMVYDQDKKRQEKIKKDGYLLVNNRIEAYDHVDIIVGASGTEVIPQDEYTQIAPHTLLANMASTDNEFSAWNLRPRGKIIDQVLLDSDKKYLAKYVPLPWRSLYRIDLGKTYFYLANGGFPTDFSGKINPVPSSDIQLTSALLLGGAIQAVSKDRSLFFDLDISFQNKVFEEYQKIKVSNGV